MMRAGLAIAVAALAGCRSAPVWTALSPDHRTPVHVVARGDRSCVTIGRRDDGCYDALALDGLVFSVAGNHVAYPARIGARWTVVRDGVAGPGWDGIGALMFHRDGGRLAYAALADGSWRVVVNDDVGPAFDAVHWKSFTFAASGRRFAYAARAGDSTHVVVDGIRGPGWEAVGQIAFDAEGRRVVHVGRRAGRAHLVVDGETGPPQDAIAEIALSPSGDGYAYAARDHGQWWVVEPQSRSGPWAAIRALRYAPSGGGLIFVARTDAGEGVAIGGVVQRWHDSVEAPVFAGDGRRWGYIGHDSGASAVIVNGETIGREREAHDLALSGATNRTAYVARRGDSVAVVDDRGRHPFDMVITGSLQFLGDGSRWVCLIGDSERRRLRVVVEGSATGRPVDWAEITRLIERDPSEETLRAWVAAEGELIAAGGK